MSVMSKSISFTKPMPEAEQSIKHKKGCTHEGIDEKIDQRGTSTPPEPGSWGRGTILFTSFRAVSPVSASRMSAEACTSGLIRKVRNDLLAEQFDRLQRFLRLKITERDVTYKIAGSGRADLLLQKSSEVTCRAGKCGASLHQRSNLLRKSQRQFGAVADPKEFHVLQPRSIGALRRPNGRGCRFC